MAVKKVLGTLAAIVLAVGLVAGCSKTEATPQGAQSPAASEESVEAEAESTESESEDAADAEVNDASSEAENAEQEADATEEENASAKAEVFPETVLMDQDGVKVTVEGFTVNEYDERVLNVTVTNNTSSEVETSGITLIADGNLIMTRGYVEAPAGSTVSEEYVVNAKNLEDAGIVSIHELSMVFTVTGDDLGESSEFTDTVSVVTDTESVVNERDMSLFQELHNEDGIVVLVESKARMDQFGSPEYLLLLENNTDDTLLFEPILQLSDGHTRAGYSLLPPHTKLTLSNNVQEGDTCAVRVSLVHGKYDIEKLFETDEVTVEMP